MRAVLDVVMLALNIYTWILIASAVLSWLIAFNVVNTRNQFVATVWDMLYRLTEPVLRPIRERMPNLGGLDLSPDFHPLTASGEADRRLTFLGPPSEGVMFFQLGALRPQQNHHLMQDILTWIEHLEHELLSA